MFENLKKNSDETLAYSPVPPGYHTTPRILHVTFSVIGCQILTHQKHNSFTGKKNWNMLEAENPEALITHLLVTWTGIY